MITPKGMKWNKGLKVMRKTGIVDGSFKPDETKKYVIPPSRITVKPKNATSVPMPLDGLVSIPVLSRSFVVATVIHR